MVNEHALPKYISEIMSEMCNVRQYLFACGKKYGAFSLVFCHIEFMQRLILICSRE